MDAILFTGGGGGVSSDDVTAKSSDVLKGTTALTSDSNDELIEGTLELTGNALPEHVLMDKTFYNTEAHTKETGSMPNNGITENQELSCGNYFTVKKGYHDEDFTITAKTLESQTLGTAVAGHIYKDETAWVNGEFITGEMEVNSILSFSVAANSGRRVLATWKNPKAALGKPYSGVYIRYSTSGYPEKTGGTQIYKGAGDNTGSEGVSSAFLMLPALNTTYYFSIYPYVTCSTGELTGEVINTSTKTGTIVNKTFTYSQNYTIPAGYTKADFFCVGGGSSGCGSTSMYSIGGGGGGGYTSTVTNISVSAGQSLSVIVGAGGAASSSLLSNAGNTSSVSISGSTLCSAAGGSNKDYKGYSTGSSGRNINGRNGGSGGGNGTDYYSGEDGDYITGRPNAGGSNGGNGGGTSSIRGHGGNGQGTTTRAWGSSTGTLYAGGGGGAGGSFPYGNAEGSNGGAGGGGRGAKYNGYAAASGTAGTGGGGGGGAPSYPSGSGGSGIVLIKLY